MQQIHNTHSLISAPLSLSLSHFPLSFPPFTHFLTLTLFRTQSLSLSHLSSAFFFFLLFTLMRGLKSSNKVCLLKNSSYSAFLLLRSRFFFLFFCQFIFLVLSISHSHSLVIVMYQNKLNILFTSSLNSVKIFHTFR